MQLTQMVLRCFPAPVRAAIQRPAMRPTAAPSGQGHPVLHKLVHRPRLPVRHAVAKAKAGIATICRYVPVVVGVSSTVVPSNVPPAPEQSTSPVSRVATAEPTPARSFYPPQYVGNLGGFWPVARVSPQSTTSQSRMTLDSTTTPASVTPPELVPVPPPVSTTPPQITAPPESAPISVPEPSSLGILAAGVMMLALRPKRRN
jgi:hypothetical protein